MLDQAVNSDSTQAKDNNHVLQGKHGQLEISSP